MPLGSKGSLAQDEEEADGEGSCYPLGRLQIREEIFNPEECAALIDEVKEAPERLRNTIAGLAQEQLGKSCRSGGWTVR